MTNLDSKDQRLLFRGKEKADDERLDMAGIKDMSKVILLEDPASKERKLMSKNNANSYALDAVMKVRTEVDKLSHKVRVTHVTLIQIPIRVCRFSSLESSYYWSCYH